MNDANKIFIHPRHHWSNFVNPQQAGKLYFGYIYGLGAVGSVSMYLLLNVMSDTGIDMYRTISILGYCLLPMVFLALMAVFISMQ